MARNKFGGTPLQSSAYVMESKTADLYADTWNSLMTKKDKQGIAKQLNIKVEDKAFDKDFADFDGNQADMVMDIVGKYLEQNECNESRPDFAQYQQLWKQMSIEDKQNIAKDLKHDKFNQFDVDLSKLSNDDYDIADDIITVWLAKHQSLNESADLYLYQQAHALNVDEGWLKWIVGMVSLRFIWKKISRNFKNKIMKIAGVPQSLWSKFNNQDLDSLPITYKDKVSHTLTQNYDGSVNESLQLAICNIFKHTQDYINESVQPNDAWQLLDYHFTKPVDEAWDYKKDCPLNRAMDFVTSATYASKFKQPVQSKFGVKFEADFRTGNALKAFNELSESQQNEFLKMLGMVDEAACDEEVAEVFNGSSIDHRTHILSSIGVPYADIDAMLSMEYQQLPEETRLAIAKHMSNKDEVYEQDGVIYTNAGKESVIKKLDSGKYGIAGNDGKLWDAQYDTLKEASEALKAYHVNESLVTKLDEAYDMYGEKPGVPYIPGFLCITNATYGMYNIVVDRDVRKDGKFSSPLSELINSAQARELRANSKNLFVIPINTKHKDLNNVVKQIISDVKSAYSIRSSDEAAQVKIYVYEIKYYSLKDKSQKTKQVKIESVYVPDDVTIKQHVQKKYPDAHNFSFKLIDDYDVNEANTEPQPVKVARDIKIPDGSIIKAGTDIISSEPAQKMSQGNDAADLYVIKAKNDKGKVVKTQAAKSELEFDRLIDESHYDKVRDPWNHWNSKTVEERKALVKAVNVGVLDYTVDFIELPLPTQAAIATYLDKQKRTGKLDESEDSLDYVDAYDARQRKYDCDETKLEDAYHDFIDKKLQDWFNKKTIGELSNDEKKIFFGRIKRTWPKKKKELGFTDESAEDKPDAESVKAKDAAYNAIANAKAYSKDYALEHKVRDEISKSKDFAHEIKYEPWKQIANDKRMWEAYLDAKNAAKDRNSSNLQKAISKIQDALHAMK